MAQGRFRDDLFARLNLWTFSLPGLAERREDIAPNLDYELDRFAQQQGKRVTFNKEARLAYLDFAASQEARWLGNFRDLAASVTRMATLSPSGRIDVTGVATEVARLQRLWTGAIDAPANVGLEDLLDAETVAAIDPFDRVQLVEAIRVCRASRSLSEAGRTLFAASRTRRKTENDADRLRKYLTRFHLSWESIHR